MNINNKYIIEAVDDRNIALMKLGIAKEGKNVGKETRKVIGYYNDIKHALKAMCKLEIFGTGLKDLEVINNKIEELYKYIDQTV